MLPIVSSASLNQARCAITACFRQDEQRFVNALLAVTELENNSRQRIEARALSLIATIRRPGLLRRSGPMAAMLEQFPLTSPEGLRLMGLAEALLRVPDAATADRLIGDKLGTGNWHSHRAKEHPLWLNGALTALMLSCKLAAYTTLDTPTSRRQQVLGALLRPLQRWVMGNSIAWLGTRFVFASSSAAALARARKLASRGYAMSFDMLGEGARCERDAQRYFEHYQEIIRAQGSANKPGSTFARSGIDPFGGNVSVKLSALHPRYEPAQRQRVLTELVPRLLALAQLARSNGLSLTIDAEESWRLDLSLDVFAAVFCSPSLAGWSGLGLALQAYQKCALAVLDWLLCLAAGEGRTIPVRLVKGAYWDSEIKASQQGAYEGYPVLTRKASTDLNYQACAHFLLSHRQSFYPQFASHNPYTIATVIELDRHLSDRSNGLGQGFEFQRLHGMGEALFEQVLAQGLACRVYAPVGKQVDLLSYLVRRILENGANSSVVNHLHKSCVDAQSLVQNPWAKAQAWGQKCHPRIALPRALFPGLGLLPARLNALGCDLNDRATLELLQEGIATHAPSPLCEGGASLNGAVDKQIMVRNPARQSELLARLELDSPEQLQAKLQRAELAFLSWARTDPAERSKHLRNLANVLQSHRQQLIALCIAEGGKTLADSVDEVREAVDFCRYYAQGAGILFAESAVQARGVVLCISPWNFPLAIFIGQICAALACGNSVLAKPAMQSLLIARYVIELIDTSGIPADCCQLLMAPGIAVGEQVLPDVRIQAVLFTGSLETGCWLNRALAQRQQPCPLIAETGGQNAMLVDATALLEQAVDAVISSAFRSAGQRCSALRVLFVQQDIADDFTAMLVGAMAELVIGDPALISSDLGPLIDERARKQCQDHCTYLQNPSTQAQLIYRCQLTKDCEQGYFFPPQLYEINHMNLLKGEVFGPIVHLIRFPAGAIDAVLEQINNSGYGLTLGIQSRIESTCRDLAQRAQVGNVYINRNMIGAMVGVQPFGGRGLSGTGPKAGGPYYLHRLVRWPGGVGGGLNKAALAATSTALARTKQMRVKNTGGDTFTRLASAQREWSLRGAAGRITCIEAFSAWLFNTVGPLKLVDDLLAGVAREMRQVAGDLLLQPVLLPGPTGESNCYQLEARGLVLVVLEEDSDFGVFFRQVLAALLAGNSVLAVLPEDPPLVAVWHRFKAGMEQTDAPSHLLATGRRDELCSLITQAQVAAVCVASGSNLPSQLAQLLASRPGAICPLVSETNPNCLITRLSYEKTISTNTAAAGGNISLLSLEA